jgi:FAD/FMN-containing dehydrogenase/Fe-S oxidoreductase
VIDFNSIKTKFSGELYSDETHRLIYSTDASEYKEKPLAVAFPKHSNDVKALIEFAHNNKVSLIPRGAGTSLAGQVTGSGIVVDVSKYMNKILEFDIENKRIKVQPGVILSELNTFLKPYNLFFGPETSTANRCTIGGMAGNNACGLHSLVYGSTRDHTHSIKALLSDNSEIEFKELNLTEFQRKLSTDSLEGKIYRQIYSVLSDNEFQKEISEHYPDKEITRRNTGYALDLLVENSVFGTNEKGFNFCKLLCGSEGTLAFFTEITLNLIELPPKYNTLFIVQFEKFNQIFDANLIALKYSPTAIELTDKTILELTKFNKELKEKRFFLKGNPEAVLIIEFASPQKNDIEKTCERLENELKTKHLGYHYQTVWDDDINKVWELRRAGLGILSNMKGDARPVSLIEDTAVRVDKLEAYINDIQNLLNKHNLKCVYHAHIGTGELHIRPVINLKDSEELKVFKTVAYETAHIVKKHKGSLSGEHGDGRLRGEFLSLMYGEKIYKAFKEIKHTWDSQSVFNAGKIIDTPQIDKFLRYNTGQREKQIETVFDFSDSGGFIRTTEKCKGSGDCIKPLSAGGMMCPSYKATSDEKNSTRARANLLREIISNENKPFKNKDLYEILDLCLSCKACKTECPSNVDITKLKAEFLQHYYDNNGVPLRVRAVAYIKKINHILSKFPKLSNAFLGNSFILSILNKLTGFSAKRKIPLLSEQTLIKSAGKLHLATHKKKVYLFADEFTNYNDTDIGIKTILLLDKLGYQVVIPKIFESGRTYLSKGLVRTAKKIAKKNLSILKHIITKETPIIGIEPSTILTFRDEYLDFFSKDEESYKTAEEISKYSLMIDEFLEKEMKVGHIKAEQFTDKKQHIKLHGHCHQKAIASTNATKFILSFPKNYSVEEIPSGCCGMAGSFGYEKQHYNLSMKIGEMILFPAVRNAAKDTLIAAPGTSCRCQIKDGTGKDAQHPIEILFDALI